MIVHNYKVNEDRLKIEWEKKMKKIYLFIRI